MAAGLAALRDNYIDSRFDLAHRVFRRSDQRSDRHSMLMAHIDHGLRRHAERVGDQFDRMLKCSLEQLQRVFRLKRDGPIGTP